MRGTIPPLAALGLVLGVAACGNADPGHPDEQVGYRTGYGDEGQANSGERGNVIITEMLWSGSVTNDGVWDVEDVFLEIKNQGARPLNLSQWFLEVTGTSERTYRIPDHDFKLDVGQHRYIATKTSGCFPEPDWLIEDLELPYGDPFRVTIRDRDERLMEPSGSREMPPFAGGYDLVASRSMERVELMFGGRGTEPHVWHFYTEIDITDPRSAVDVQNNDRIAEHCRQRTLASPGRPNSPDYSGAFAAGNFE